MTLPWHAILAMAVGYCVLAAWAVLIGGSVCVSVVGRWLARRRRKQAIEELIAPACARYVGPSRTP